MIGRQVKIGRRWARVPGGVMWLLAAATASATAQDPAVVRAETDAAALRARIEKIVAPYLAANDFHGVVAIQRAGEPALSLSLGLASLELSVPHQADDVFLIGSISKQFTAAAVLLLEESGALRTADPVRKHLPEFAADSPDTPLTIHHLLNHTGGVTDVYSLQSFGHSEGRSGTFEDVISELVRLPLAHEPGSSYAYSNGGYSLLAAIIERASGMPYGEFVAARLFRPLGLGRTSHDGLGPVTAGRVPGYDPWGARDLAPTMPPVEAFSTGSGSLWSSAADLLEWTRALHGGQVLADSSYRKLVTDYGSAYGYGVSVFRRFGRPVVGHDGRVSGYSSDVAHYPDDGLTVVLLSNVQSGARDEIRIPIAAAALGEPVTAAAATASGSRTFADAPPYDLAPLEGVYSFGPALSVTIVARSGRLLARANEGSYSELVPLEGGGWFSRVLYATVRFSRDSAGRVDAVLWGPGDGAPRGNRID